MCALRSAQAVCVVALFTDWEWPMVAPQALAVDDRGDRPVVCIVEAVPACAEHVLPVNSHTYEPIRTVRDTAALRLNSLELHPIEGIYVHVGESKANRDNVLPDIVVLPFRRTSSSCALCGTGSPMGLVAASTTEDARKRRRTIMRQLHRYQLDAHVFGVGGRARLISGANLASPAPLLRATYRNRRDVRIQEAGVSGDALHAMLHRRIEEAGMDPSASGFHRL